MLLLTGYTPYPKQNNEDTRLPHIAAKLDARIHKTALGAEKTVSWQHLEDLVCALELVRDSNFTLVGLEQDSTSQPLPNFKVPRSVAILLGEEVNGLSKEHKNACQQLVEIPMFGNKESFNVVTATAMMLYHMRFASST